MTPTSYDKLWEDLQAYVVDNSKTFVDKKAIVLENAMLRVCRAMPLEMYTETMYFSLAGGEDKIRFSQLGPNGIKVVTVDYLTVYPDLSPIERRSRAYLQMHGGRGVPRVFCDIPGGVLVSPKPILSVQLSMTHMVQPPFSADEKTNWYTENVQDLCLSAARMEAGVFLMEPEVLSAAQADFATQLVSARRDFQDMLRTNIYNPLAISAEPAPKGGSA